MAKVIQVIESEEIHGKGTPESPLRGVKKYWTLDGELLAENDPLSERDDGHAIAHPVRSRT